MPILTRRSKSTSIWSIFTLPSGPNKTPSSIRSGRTISTLFEDNVKQTIKYFSRETHLPLTIGLLVDVSNSQRNLIEIERRAGAAFSIPC